MTDYLPGPWRFKIGDSFSATDYLIEQDGGDDRGFERGLVIMRWKPSPYCETKIEQANARLMAAAPELLEIVREAESRVVCQCIEICGDNPDCLHHRIEAIIAKAEGQNP